MRIAVKDNESGHARLQQSQDDNERITVIRVISMVAFLFSAYRKREVRVVILGICGCTCNASLPLDAFHPRLRDFRRGGGTHERLVGVQDRQDAGIPSVSSFVTSLGAAGGEREHVVDVVPLLVGNHFDVQELVLEQKELVSSVPVTIALRKRAFQKQLFAVEVKLTTAEHVESLASRSVVAPFSFRRIVEACLVTALARQSTLRQGKHRKATREAA